MTVVALVGPGDALHRALAVAAAEAGAKVALATLAPTTGEEFAVHSVANEVWTIGAEHFVRVMDSCEPTAAASFADEVADRFGRCDVFAVTTGGSEEVDLDELSKDEWEPELARHLTGPFLAAQSVGRVMERQGAGTVFLVMPARSSVVASVVGGAFRGLAGAASRAWAVRGVRVEAVPPEEAVEKLKVAIAAH